MNSIEMKDRTKRLALRVITMAEELPHTHAGRNFANQITRSACSVAANYRAACRARTKAEFAAKIGIAEEEADETLFWLEMIEAHGCFQPAKIAPLKKESDEITAILVASRKTAKSTV